MVSTEIPIAEDSCGQEGCAGCPAGQLGVFGALPADVRKELGARERHRIFRPGQILLTPDLVPSGVFCMESGVVREVRASGTAEQCVLDYVTSGGVVGLEAGLLQVRFGAEAVARTEVRACFIRYDLFSDLMYEYPQFAESIFRFQSAKLLEGRRRVCGLLNGNARSRVADALLYFETRLGIVNWTRKELAEWAGIATETVIRVLNDFCAKGMARKSGRRIMISDHQALREIIQSS